MGASIRWNGPPQQKAYLISIAPTTLPPGGVRTTTRCMRHPGQVCTIEWQPPAGVAGILRPITWNFAGPLCTPWTYFGSRLGLADPATESWQMYTTVGNASSHDLRTMENSVDMPKQLYRDGMSAERWQIVSLIVDTKARSGASRRRRWQTAINMEPLVVCWPFVLSFVNLSDAVCWSDAAV